MHRKMTILHYCVPVLICLMSVGVADVFGRPSELQPLTLNLAPQEMPATQDCPTHGAPQAKPAGRGKPGRSVPPFESEHRPLPVRNYFLGGTPLGNDAWAMVLHPDGSNGPLAIIQDQGAKITLPMPSGDGPLHGANNFYVVDQQVSNDVLTIRTAKWLTIHHSCGWGHDHRFDSLRQSSQHLDLIPFEIVIDQLWDKNFHSEVRAGDLLNIKILRHGQPVQGANILLTSGEKWQYRTTTGQDGASRVRLIDDYFVDNWGDFKPDRKAAFTVLVDFTENTPGSHNDRHYSQIRYLSTFTWRYNPARQQYASAGYGLLVGMIALVCSTAGIFIYREKRRKPFHRSRLHD